MPYALQIGSYGTTAEAQEMKDTIIHNLLRFPPDVLNASIEDTTPPTPQSDWTEIHSSTVTDTYSGTTAANLTTISSVPFTSAALVWVQIRDTAGKRSGYFYGSDSILINYNAANGTSTTLNYILRMCLRVSSAGNYLGYNTATTTGYGIYPSQLTSAGVLTLQHRYSSSYSLTIDGTYSIRIYTLDPPFGVSIFD